MIAGYYAPEVKGALTTTPPNTWRANNFLACDRVKKRFAEPFKVAYVSLEPQMVANEAEAPSDPVIQETTAADSASAAVGSAVPPDSVAGFRRECEDFVGKLHRQSTAPLEGCRMNKHKWHLHW